MDEYAETGRVEPRSVAEIFEDLRALAQSDGALHEISNLIYRDIFVTVDRRDGRVIDHPDQRWSTSKLNKNEVLLLLGLMVQPPTDHTYALQAKNDEFAARVDVLFCEFHDRMVADLTSTFDPKTHQFVEKENPIGLFAREAIYYGADGFYLHQFFKFSQKRYQADAMWLTQNVGLTINQMLEIVRYILDHINAQMTEVGRLRKLGYHLRNKDLTNSLLIAKEDVRRQFGAKSDAFFAKFVTPIKAANKGFTSPISLNTVAIAPIIEFDDYLYVPLQYRLCESIYESPFFWMMDDHKYADMHAENRGRFSEQTAAEILNSVFGTQNVYENVVISRNGRDYGSEIDVLVVYGEFAIVVQAKSKRVTLNARAGDSDALEKDFKGAIQNPYQQALKCIELIKAGAKCVTKDGKELELHALPRFFPVVVLSDSFPASTMLSRAMLERSDQIAPVIWDIGELDCVARLLPTPVEMLLYLKCRSDVFDNILSDSEYNYISYHIESKLALPPDTSIMMLDRDCSMVVDDFMIAEDLGINADRPVGILERVQIPVISELLTELKNADPRVASVVIDLYDFSSAALQDISETILKVRAEVSTERKAIKAFSIPTASGGLTYAVVLSLDAKAAKAARAIGAKHKYDKKSDRWYVIVDSVQTNNPIDSLLPLIWSWIEDKGEAHASLQVAKMFNSSQQRGGQTGT
ncbi:MAG: nuclease-related domain-containing protein [Gammaproteobacteria bacterium]|nr:nuclease-related domain-containing protein [Gammaproteobacteria bacterium]